VRVRMASALGELEFVLTDATRNMIAVIRPVLGLPRGGVPRWVNGRDCSGRNCIVVVGPDGAAGLVITGAKVLDDLFQGVRVPGRGGEGVHDRCC
jgi:hypothetical protein